jgi:hypothetical protein
MTVPISNFFANQALVMEPVEKFCQILVGLPESGREQAVSICCDAIGCGLDIADSATSSMSVEEMFRSPGLEDFRKKMETLVWTMHVRPEVLLLAIHNHLTSVLDYLSKHEASNAAIDSDLEWLDKLKGYKKLPKDQRPTGFEADAFIDNAIKLVRARAIKRSEERMTAGVLAEKVEEACATQLSATYWRDWIKRRTEDS